MADTKVSGVETKETKLCEAFTVDFIDSPAQKNSLQDSFLKFRRDKQKNNMETAEKLKKVEKKKKKKEIRNQKKMKKKRKKKQRNPQQMQKLREKFVNQAKKYFGVPYAKRYWTPDDEEYYSKKFLDCCGLVRQVMIDLRKDFGFRIGPWNQAYMFDTLPIVIEREEDMKPGDLVFISGIYPNPKSRQQKHHMTHVEIWAGDGCKTIGARWNKGKVQVFDHYKFEAKSFHSEQYYFRSLDTWLGGTCKSFCSEHKWKRRKFNPSKKSVFALHKEKKDDGGLTSGQEKHEGQTKGNDCKEETSKTDLADESQTTAQSTAASGSDYDDEDSSESISDLDEENEELDDDEEDIDEVNATPLGIQSLMDDSGQQTASTLAQYRSSAAQDKIQNTVNSRIINQNEMQSIRESNLEFNTKCSLKENSPNSSSSTSIFTKTADSMINLRTSKSNMELLENPKEEWQTVKGFKLN